MKLAITWRHAIFIGLAQILALCPGVSRSGITISAALWLGYSRRISAKFSMLLAMPTILAAGILNGYELLNSASPILLSRALWSGLLSFGCAYLAIWLFLGWLKKFSFWPFVLYRVLLGALLLIIFL